MLAMCFSTAPTVRTSASAIAGVREALGDQLEDLALPRGERVERVLAAEAAVKLRDDLVDDGPAPRRMRRRASVRSVDVERRDPSAGSRRGPPTSASSRRA